MAPARSTAGSITRRERRRCAAMRDAGGASRSQDPRFTTAQVVGPSMLSLDGPGARPPPRRRSSSRCGSARCARRSRTAVREEAGLLLRRARAGRRGASCGAASPARWRRRSSTRSLGALARRRRRGARPLRRDRRRRSATSAPGRPARPAGGRGDGVARPTALRLGAARRRWSEDEYVSNAAVMLLRRDRDDRGDDRQRARVPARRAASAGAGGPRDRAVVEESLRLEPAAAAIDRYATADVELGAARDRRGRARADLDHRRQPRPGDRSRSPTASTPSASNARRHLAFAGGPHVGAVAADRAPTRALRRAHGARPAPRRATASPGGSAPAARAASARTARSVSVTGVPSAFATAAAPRSNAGSVSASAASASASASARSSGHRRRTIARGGDGGVGSTPERQAATGTGSSSPRWAASACSRRRLAGDQHGREDRAEDREAGADDERALEALGERDRHATSPPAASVVGAAVGDRGEDRQAERAADLLRRVDQPGGQAGLVRLDARSRRRPSSARTRSRGRRPRAATGTGCRRRSCRPARPARTRAGRPR